MNAPVSVGRNSFEQARAEVEILVTAGLAGVNDLGLPGPARGWVPDGDGRPAFWIVIGVGAGRVVHHGHRDGDDRFLVCAGDAAGAEAGLVEGYVAQVGYGDSREDREKENGQTHRGKYGYRGMKWSLFRICNDNGLT